MVAAGGGADIAHGGLEVAARGRGQGGADIAHQGGLWRGDKGRGRAGVGWGEGGDTGCSSRATEQAEVRVVFSCVFVILVLQIKLLE